MELKPQDVSEKVGKARRRYVSRKTIPYIFGYLVTLLLMMSIAFIGDAKFDFENLKRWEWWIPNIITAISVVVLLITHLNYSITTKTENNKDIKDVDAIFANRVRDSRFVSADLEKYIVAQNRKNKRRVYVSRITDKIVKLNQSPLTSAKDLRVWQKGTQEEKDRNRYCKRREKLETFIADDFLNKNLDFMKVDYQEWTYSALMAGVQSMKEKGRWVTKDEFISKNALKKSLSKIVITVCMTSILITVDFKDTSALVKMFTQIFSMMFSLLTADQLADDFVNTHLRGFAFDRLEFFTNFESYQAKLAAEEEAKKKAEEEASSLWKMEFKPGDPPDKYYKVVNLAGAAQVSAAGVKEEKTASSSPAPLPSLEREEKGQTAQGRIIAAATVLQESV